MYIPGTWYDRNMSRVLNTNPQTCRLLKKATGTRVPDMSRYLGTGHERVPGYSFYFRPGLGVFHVDWVSYLLVIVPA